MVSEINEKTVLDYLTSLDGLVKPGTELFMIGGSAVVLLGANIRTTADVDIALPYSKFDMAGFAEASAQAGLPVNPSFGYQGAYVELVKPLMLTLPRPKNDGSEQILFRGANLVVKTGSGAELVASKLYRYSEQDQEDIRFLMSRGNVTMSAVREAVLRLPERFREDVLVRDNLANLENDAAMWGKL